MHPLAKWIDSRKPKMTRADFADRVGMDDGHLSQFLNGTRGLSLKTAVAIERETKGAIKPADLLPQSMRETNAA